MKEPIAPNTPAMRPTRPLPFEISQVVRRIGSASYYFVRFSFSDLRGSPQQLELPRSKAREFKAVAKRLLDQGIPTGDALLLAELIREEIERTEQEPPAELVDRTGWHDKSFVFPGLDLGAAAGRILFEGAPAHPYSIDIGSPEEWKNCLGKTFNPSLPHVFAMAAALAAPLLRFSGLPGDVAFLFTHEGQANVSTVMQAAASVCTGEPSVLELQAGEPKHSSSSMRHQFADLPRLVPCGSGSVDLLEDMLGQRLGISRQGHDAGNASSSSTEVPPRSIILAAVDVRVDRRALLGNRPDHSDTLVIAVPGHPPMAEAMARQSFDWTAAKVANVCGRHAGHALPAFVGATVRHLDKLPQMVEDKIESFLATVKREAPLSVSEEKVLNAFALVCAAGTLAAEWEISPWSKERCVEACRHMALGHFELIAEADADPFLTSIRAAAYDDALFPIVEEKQVLDQLTSGGARGARRTLDGRMHLLVARDNLIHSTGSKDAVDALISRLAKQQGLITRGPDGRVFRQVSVAGWPGGGGRKPWLCLDVERLMQASAPAGSRISFAPVEPLPKYPLHSSIMPGEGKTALRRSQRAVWVRRQRSKVPEISS